MGIGQTSFLYNPNITAMWVVSVLRFIQPFVMVVDII